MTKLEAVALYRILSVLAGWDEIIDTCEVEDDLLLLFERLPAPLRADLDDEDYDQIVESLRAQIECNLHWHALANLRRVQDVPDPGRVLS